MEKWQPIETAPKDGSLILVHDFNEGFMIVSWVGDNDDDFDNVWQVCGAYPECYYHDMFTYWAEVPDEPEYIATV